ncbi:MAG: phospholipase A2 [Actinomycetota bacterium]
MKIAAWVMTFGLVTGLMLFGPTVAAGADDRVDGCTAVPDAGPNFDFLDACNEHDLCYLDRPYGDDRAARRRCDREFFDAMIAACRADYEGRWLTRSSCYGVAGVYYVGVRAFGAFGWIDRNSASITDPAETNSAA